MSWTDDPRVAAQYGSAVLTCIVPASVVLAVLPLIHSTAAYAETHTEFVVDVPPDVVVTEVDAATVGGGGVKLHFRGKSPSAIDANVRRFLRELGLDRMRPSALGWTAEGKTVTFYGAQPVILEVARRHPVWAAR